MDDMKMGTPCVSKHNNNKSAVESEAKETDRKIKTLEEACNLARKWLPPVTEGDKITLMGVLTGTENGLGMPFLRKYIELLRPYTDIIGISDENNKPREADCVASGVVFFYGCLFYIMHFPGWGNHIEDIFLYNLLYILVDHYIDDIRINDIVKNQAIVQMFILIKNPLAHETLPLIDPVLKTIAMVYHRLITRCPNTQLSIVKLFKAEIEGVNIQKSGKYTRDQYYDIAVRKGGYTMEILQHIVGDIDVSISNASYELGVIMQLIDDQSDIGQDKGNGIHTIATHDWENKGNLDDLWIDVIHRINKIDDRFTIFKIIYTIFAVYIPDRYRENFSEELWSRTTCMNLFDYNYGCDGSALLVEAIMNELIAMETLEKWHHYKNSQI